MESEVEGVYLQQSYPPPKVDNDAEARVNV